MSIRIAVTGAAGKMGRTLIQTIHETDGMELSVALEQLGHSAVGMDAGSWWEPVNLALLSSMI